MADLRVLMAALGYRDVRTVLNSGNILFTVPPKARGEPASRIQQAIASRLGLATRVTVLTATELEVALAQNPLSAIADNPSRLLLYVLNDARDRLKVIPLTRQQWTPDALGLGQRVAYLWCPEGILKSRLAAAIDQLLGDAVTARNWNTMTKLHALAGHAEDR
jgi:uncharacterized protein (DUF1697 family)